MTSNDEFILIQTTVQKAATHHADGLSVVLVFFFDDIAIPVSKVLFLDVHNRRIDIKGQRIFDFIKFHFIRTIFVDDLTSAIGCTDDLVERHLVRISVQPVEYDGFHGLQLIVHQISHIGVIGHKGRTIDHQHFLIDQPTLRHSAVQKIQAPHTIVFNDNAFIVPICHQLGQMLFRQFILLFDRNDIDTGSNELVRLVFDFTFLA